MLEVEKKCPVCGEEITPAEVEKHIERHFEGSAPESPIEPAQPEHYRELKRIEEGEE